MASTSTVTAEVSQWAIGYDYNISKRTVGYVQYAQQDQNDTAEAITGTANGGLLGYGSSVANFDLRYGQQLHAGLLCWYQALLLIQALPELVETAAFGRLFLFQC